MIMNLRTWLQTNYNDLDNDHDNEPKNLASDILQWSR